MVICLILVLGLRPPLLKKLNRSATGAVTNAEALIGAEVCVTQDVTSETGLVVLAGDTWTARTASGTLVAGSHARVRAIEGATAIVEPLPPQLRATTKTHLNTGSKSRFRYPKTHHITHR